MPVFSLYSAMFLWVWVCVCSGNGSNIHGSLTGTHVFREVSQNLLGRSDLGRGNRMIGDHLHEVVIVIRQRNINQLISLLDESSDQSSLKYGKHLSKEQVTTLTSNPSSRDTVVSYLRIYGATVVSETIDGDFLTVSASIAVWEEVFNTKIFAFYHTRKNGYKSITVRAEEYYVPRELDSHIQGVFNLIDMPSRHCNQMSVQCGKSTESFTKLDRVSYQSAAQYMTSYQMEAYYNMSQKKNWCPQINHSCVSGSDLEKFQEYFSVRVELLNSTFQSSNDDNGMHCSAVPSGCHEEFVGSDIVTATSQRHPSVFSGSASTTDWLLAIANNRHPPSVLIVDNIAEEKDMPLFVKETFNNLAIKLCAMGVTIVVDAGVDGAVGQSDTCEYRPLLYSSSPYVTSVGTVSGPSGCFPYRDSCPTGGIKVSVSGGGFSIFHPTPTWQHSAVEAYHAEAKKMKNIPQSGYNTAGRGYPDITLSDYDYLIRDKGRIIRTSGTAISAAVLAGMITRINAARLAAGKGSVGWLNPAMYANPHIFNDVMSGDDMYNRSGRCCTHGFSATKGWDPASGLGSVDYTALELLFLPHGTETKLLDEREVDDDTAQASSVDGGRASCESKKNAPHLSHQVNCHASHGTDIAAHVHGSFHALSSLTSTIKHPSAPSRRPLHNTQYRVSQSMSAPILIAKFVASKIGAFSSISLASLRMLQTGRHIGHPISLLTAVPNSAPSMPPSIAATGAPSIVTSERPTFAMTGANSPAPSERPTLGMTGGPSATPSERPTLGMAGGSSGAPGQRPILGMTGAPSVAPSERPTLGTTSAPSAAPSERPTVATTGGPSVVASERPTLGMTGTPSIVASERPTLGTTGAPSVAPSERPTFAMTGAPSVAPSERPTVALTGGSSVAPSESPTVAMSGAPSGEPSQSPTVAMTGGPSGEPSQRPTVAMSGAPSATPSQSPTVAMAGGSSGAPSQRPTLGMTSAPSATPSRRPTLGMAGASGVEPSQRPTVAMTGAPSAAPSERPSAVAITPSSRTFVPTVAAQSAQPARPLSSSPTPSPTPDLSQTPSVFNISESSSLPTTSNSSDEQDQSNPPSTYRTLSSYPISYPTISPNCATASTLLVTQAITGMLPSNVENNSTFLLSIQTTLTAALTLLPKEVTDIDISDTSEFEVQLSYMINISGCTAASNLIAKLRSIMDSGYFIETLRNYTGIAELNISEPLITVNATSGPPQRASMTVSDPGMPIGISAGVVGAIIGSVLLVCLTLAFCYYGVVCKRMGNDSFRMQVAGRDARMTSL